MFMIVNSIDLILGEYEKGKTILEEKRQQINPE
jgi:hypothetical protein